MPELTDNRQNTKVYSRMTMGNWLHVYDATELGKLKFFLGRYRRGQGAEAQAVHFVDIPAIRPILQDLSWGKAVDFTDFKGSKKPDGFVESRVMTVQTNIEQGKVFWTVSNGPGKTMPTGAVQPAGDPTQKVTMVFSIADARIMALDLLEFLVAVRVTRALKSLTSVTAVERVTDNTIAAELGFDSPLPPQAGAADQLLPDYEKMAEIRNQRRSPDAMKFGNGDEVPQHLRPDFLKYKKHNHGNEPESVQDLKLWAIFDYSS